MSNSEQKVEQEIQDKGLTAPRITPADIDAAIVGEFYFTAGDGYAGAMSACPDFNALPEDERKIEVPVELDLLTFCVLTLRNGFTVTGESACASPENFDAEIGKKIAYENARNKVWMFEGYLLKEKLHQAELDKQF